MLEKKPYKVVLESLTQEKRKLKSTVIYDEKAPPGYTFCPIGAPELANYCKELSRKRGVDIGIVSVSRNWFWKHKRELIALEARPKNLAHRDPTNVSHHIHRVGYHFRNDIFDIAFTQLGLKGPGSRRTLRPRAPADGVAPTAIARRMDSYGANMSVTADESAQERQKRMVSLAIKDLFPKIPEDDQKAIIARAFQEGSDRIGTQESIPLPRRVQLAVLAHVRHTKTEYDNLLKTVGWHDARKLVEQTCLDQIVRWRGETEEGDGELEDIFQEVIVLDDDEDDNARDLSDRQEHESSVEIIADQHNPEDVDVDAYSPPPLTSRQSVPREPPRSGPPAIISVKPIRAPRPTPLLTHDAFNQELQDAKLRVGQGQEEAPTLTSKSHSRAVAPHSVQEQASNLRQMPAANRPRYVSDPAAAIEYSHHDRFSRNEALHRPSHPQVYQSTEHSSEQQRLRAYPEGTQRALPQRRLPSLDVNSGRSANAMPHDHSQFIEQPIAAKAGNDSFRNGYHTPVERPFQPTAKTTRPREEREVIDLTQTSPIATKATPQTRTTTRPNARPTSLAARPRTRSRSPGRRPVYYERVPRRVEDQYDSQDYNRRDHSYPQYRDRRDVPRRPFGAQEISSGRQLYGVDAIDRSLQSYAMQDVEEDDSRRRPRQVRELHQAPPRPRSAGHYIFRDRPGSLQDRDVAYVDRALRSRQYHPLEDREQPAVKYRDRDDPYLVGRRPI